MKFIGRDRELDALERTRLAAQNIASRMTLLTGRLRVGKTTLIQRSLLKKEALYLFVQVTSEAQLCARFVEEVRRSLNIYVPSGMFEVDILAIDLSEKEAFVAEVKRHRKAFKEKAFLEKVEHLKTTILHGVDVSSGCLTMEDM